LIQSQIAPLRFISRFSNIECTHVPGLIKLRLSLQVKSLKINPELLSAWRLQSNGVIRLDIAFDDTFLNYPKHRRPIVTVQHAPSLLAPGEPFILSNALTRAVSDIFFPADGLPTLPQTPISAHDIQEVIDATHVDFFTALASLSMTKSRSAHDAIELLCDSQRRASLQRQAKEYTQTFANVRKANDLILEDQATISGSQSEEKVDRTSQSQLLTASNEMLAEAYGIPLAAVELACTLEKDRRELLSLLESEDVRRSLVESCSIAEARVMSTTVSPSATRDLTPAEREEYEFNLALIQSRIEAAPTSEEAEAAKADLRALQYKYGQCETPCEESKTDQSVRSSEETFEIKTANEPAEATAAETTFFKSLPMPEFRRNPSQDAARSGTSLTPGKIIFTRNKSTDSVSSNDVVESSPDEAWLGGGRTRGVEPLDCAVANYWVQYSYLMRLALFFEHRVINANRYCIVCAQTMEFEGLKPAVCARQLCTMAFQELGVGFDLAQEIISHPELVDLLITLFYQAATTRTITFGAPLQIFKDYRGTRHSFRRATPISTNYASIKGLEDLGYLDYERLLACLSRIPSVSLLIEYAKRGTSFLRAQLDESDVLLFPLLQWILTSVRAHLRYLGPTEIVKPMQHAIAQFVMLSSSPEREARFQRLKRRAEAYRGPGNGSFFAWHGSPLPKWHSIMRVGLKNLSNTALMTTGAAYGPGIYMATDLMTSLGYCGGGARWKNSMFNQDILCISLCEVINHKDLKPPSPYYVVQNEEWITTRVLFILPVGRGHLSGSLRAKDVAAHLPNFAAQFSNN